MCSSISSITRGLTFEAGYDRTPARVFRQRLRIQTTPGTPAEYDLDTFDTLLEAVPGTFDGTATAFFRGQIPNVLTSFVEVGGSGLPSLYAEVVPDDTSLTSVTVALVPTGKAVPVIPNSGGDFAVRLDTVRSGREVFHVYLLSVDGSEDRAAYDAEQAKRAAQREAGRMIGLADPSDGRSLDGDFDGDFDSSVNG